MNPVLYFHTLRYLRPAQIYGRIMHAVVHPTPSDAPAPSRLFSGGNWTVHPDAVSRMTGPMTFRMINEVHTLGATGTWDDPAYSRLWRYNLHYFDYLREGAHSAERQWLEEAIRRWIGENPPGKGTGWEPFPLSRRIVNWVKWHLSGNLLPEEAVHGLAVQTRALSRHVEYEYPGNHLLANAKALLFAGMVFRGDESDGWYALGERILRQELAVQILRDGGHFERSPMYHSFVLEDLLDLLNVLQAVRDRPGERGTDLVETVRRSVQAMRIWLACMCHPDGNIALFNDAAFDVAPHPADLESYAVRLGLPASPACEDPLVVLEDSGYVRMKRGDCVAFMDVGEVGPDYIPGHGHADTLSIEVSIRGRRVIVDPGVFTYEPGEVRARDRGTGAHNTLMIDDRDSSEVWSSFRVGRRARPLALVTEVTGPRITVSCAHDGYRRMPGRPVHRRSLSVMPDGLRIEDRIDGTFRKARTGLLLHPQIRPMMVAPESRAVAMPCAGGWEIPDGGTVRWSMEGQEARYEDAEYHPGFGIAMRSSRLCGDLTSRCAVFSLSWE